MFDGMVERLLDAVEAGPAAQRALEIQVWKELLALGRLLLGYLFGLLCWNATRRDWEERGLEAGDVRLRMDSDYWGAVTTTVGPVSFPFFAYRDDSSGVGSVTRTPARRSVFPYHARCRSSLLLLEWEARLGSGHPFRRAEEELAFFTQGSVTTEDNTIARHMVRIGSILDRSWLYRKPDQIGEILRTQATRDTKTDRPIIYASSDAHAERRYVDETWKAPWKMVNGIRLWCEDRDTGQTIHLGGEFTWGDCHEVRRAFQRLIDDGILPADGKYDEDLVAQIVWVSDAMLWFDEHILPLFPGMIIILDLYHLLRWFALFAATAYGAGTKAAKKLYRAAEEAIFGPRVKAPKASTPRRGHKKKPRNTPKEHTHDRPADRRKTNIINQGQDLVTALLDLLESIKPRSRKVREERDSLANRLCNNVIRMGYNAYIARGLQVGSGAMESLHRTGCQLRTKIPGARWLAETAQAVFDLRMLHLVGNWDAFWSQPDLLQQITDAFNNPAKSLCGSGDLAEAP